MKKIFLLLLITFSFSGCEKDDICDASTVTTPLLKIDFYSTGTNPIPKNVTKLEVKENGTAVVYKTPFDGVSTISIPLKTTAKETVYDFTINKGVATEKTEVVKFTYNTNDVFVSRACGYKATFDLTNPNTLAGFVAANPSNWISNVQIVKTNIENNETHIKIFF